MLSSQSKAFGLNSVLTGVTAFFMFLFHFGLYCRPLPEEYKEPNTGLGMPVADQSNADSEFANAQQQRNPGI